MEDKVIDNLKPITGITYSGFGKKIRFTYYNIHNRVQQERTINDNYIDFLHAVFPNNFRGKKETTKTKFSQF